MLEMRYNYEKTVGMISEKWQIKNDKEILK